MASRTMTTLEFLELLSARNDGASDYRIAKILGAKQQLISLWRNGGVMSDKWAIKVADALKLPRPYVIACVNAERLKDGDRTGDTGRVWRQIADAFRDKAAVYVLAAALGLAGYGAPPVHADSSSVVRDNVYYGKSRKYRRERRKTRRDTIGRFRVCRRRKPAFALHTHGLHRTSKSACSFAVND